MLRRLSQIVVILKNIAADAVVGAVGGRGVFGLWRGSMLARFSGLELAVGLALLARERDYLKLVASYLEKLSVRLQVATRQGHLQSSICSTVWAYAPITNTVADATVSCAQMPKLAYSCSILHLRQIAVDVAVVAAVAISEAVIRLFEFAPLRSEVRVVLHLCSEKHTVFDGDAVRIESRCFANQRSTEFAISSAAFVRLAETSEEATTLSPCGFGSVNSYPAPHLLHSHSHYLTTTEYATGKLPSPRRLHCQLHS